MKAARIILDQLRPLPPEWCWRDDWYTGLDSAYGLLMKFATLNALTAREIAQIVISKKCGRRTAICANPNVDLRDSSVFDLDVMAQTFRLSAAQVRSAFLWNVVPNSQSKSSDSLRWCGQCIARGFHTSIFQMSLGRCCPIHSTPLQWKCTSCRMEIPYRLRSDVTTKPFCCPHCGRDMAPGLRRDHVKVLIPRELERMRVEHMMAFFRFEDVSLPVKLEINSKRLQLGQGELVIAPAEQGGYLSRYIGFVSHVLHDMGYTDTVSQVPLGIERVERIECGRYRMLLSDDDDGDLQRSWWPEAGDHGGISKVTGEDQLKSIHIVYRALRRHLWRHVVRNHRHCIINASRHFWWHMEGEVTTNFCPIAEAFIRWRMLWEGCGTPRYLYASAKKKEPFGLIGWISARPSPCPAHWSAATQFWVADHIFSSACIESFREQLMIAQKNQELGRISWEKEKSAVRYDSYWAVAGCDCKDRPALVYIRCPMSAPIPSLREGTKRAHREELGTQLATICR